MARLTRLKPLVLTLFIAAVVGGVSGEFIASASAADRVVVGNTGGTLSGVIQVDGRLVVIGGGNARTDLADLVGRSTVPWHRRVDLLIVPGWDDQQAIGALGLIERGSVTELVIAGQPATNAVWNALQQTAARGAVPVTVVNGHDRIVLASDVQLDIVSDQPSTVATAPYALMSLHYHQSMLTFVDASKAGVTALNSSGITVERTHVLVTMRPLASVLAQTDVVLQPKASVVADVASSYASYLGEVGTGQRVEIKLSQHELRLPLNAVTDVASATP